jgi:short-chain Z-isoprenyl diphosphate synthase
MPRHVGVILDGNRRWARAMGYSDVSEGHRRGARKIEDLLDWCRELGIPIVTLWLLSTDNLSARDPGEIAALLDVIEGAVWRLAERSGRWGARIRVMGEMCLLPEKTRRVLEEAEALTAARRGFTVNVAVGYGGREEILEAFRSYLREKKEQGATLEEAAEALTGEEISRHLYTSGQPDPDLIIRTSGEVRLSGFLLWQSAHSEFYFCDPYWPEFRKIDLMRAIRDFQGRSRRFGR